MLTPATLPRSNPTTPATKGARYTCPMHPQIIQLGPGSCPICGMALEPMDVFAEVEADPEYDSMLRRFWVSARSLCRSCCSPCSAMHSSCRSRPATRNWIEFILATPVVLWGGWPFFQRFWASIVNRSPNMFTLIGLGTGAAYLDSVVATLFPANFSRLISRHAWRRRHLLRSRGGDHHAGVARPGAGAARAPTNQQRDSLSAEFGAEASALVSVRMARKMVSRWIL